MRAQHFATRGLLLASWSRVPWPRAARRRAGRDLKDPRSKPARASSPELRCLVCQNQSIDDSNAPLAHDLRLLVRERLTAGDSDAQVMRFVDARYGEFVLLRPPLRWRTLLLWLTPLLAAARGRVDDGARMAPPPAAGRQRDTGAAVGGRGGQAAVDPRRERGRAAGPRLGWS